MDVKKAWGLWRMRITDELQVFRLYGMDVYIPQVAKEIETLTKKLIEDLKQ